MQAGGCRFDPDRLHKIMKPYCHARNSVKKWGGKPEDYLPLHNLIDESKAHHADVRHRALFHNTFGIWLLERIFGTYITNSDGTKVQVRDVGEQHVLEDLGRIPSVSDFLKNMTLQKWMGGPKDRAKKTTFIPMED